MTNHYYPSANEAARPFVAPELLADPVVYPPAEILTANRFLMPLSPAAQKLYDQIGERFLHAKP